MCVSCMNDKNSDSGSFKIPKVLHFLGEDGDVVVEEIGQVVGHQILARHAQVQGVEVPVN